VLGLACLALFFANFDGSLLVLALPAISRDFHASVPDLAEIASLLQVGVPLGLPLAVLSDRLGRRRLLAMTVAGFSLAAGPGGASPSLPWLAGARTAGIAFETAAASTATALVIEDVPDAARGLAVAALTLAGGAGVGLTTLAYPLLAPRWRPLYLAGAAGLLAAGALALRLPESRAWAASRPPRLPLAVLLRPPWRVRLLVVLAAAGLGAVLYEPASLFISLFGARALRLGPAAISAVYAASGLAAIPAIPLGGWLSDRLGRRRLSVGLTSLAAVAAAAAFSGHTVAFWLGNVAWAILAGGASAAAGAWYGELFPTRARASSEALDALAGAAGGVVGLQLLARLEPHLGLGPSLTAFGIAALVGALLLLALPETGGQTLSG
jgi:MFS family permease